MIKHKSGLVMSPTAISVAVREEIQRFESVHPNIYAAHELLDDVTPDDLQQRLRSHLFAIEDAFVNSQEWTLSKCVQALRLGIVGTQKSGRSSLVHHYLTGSYVDEETFEGGRFKKEVVVDGRSYLLLIREEGGPPDAQFSQWVDAVVMVFNVADEDSFRALYSMYAKMAIHRAMHHLPLFLVGSRDGPKTRDAAKENLNDGAKGLFRENSNGIDTFKDNFGNSGKDRDGSARATPEVKDLSSRVAAEGRVVSEAKGRKMAQELKGCGYTEVKAEFGYNVEGLFNAACQKIISHKHHSNLQPSTPPSSASFSTLHYPQPPPSQPLQPNNYTTSNRSSLNSNHLNINNNTANNCNNISNNNISNNNINRLSYNFNNYNINNNNNNNLNNTAQLRNSTTAKNIKNSPSINNTNNNNKIYNKNTLSNNTSYNLANNFPNSTHYQPLPSPHQPHPSSHATNPHGIPNNQPQAGLMGSRNNLNNNNSNNVNNNLINNNASLTNIYNDSNNYLNNNNKMINNMSNIYNSNNNNNNNNFISNNSNNSSNNNSNNSSNNSSSNNNSSNNNSNISADKRGVIATLQKSNGIVGDQKIKNIKNNNNNNNNINNKYISTNNNNNNIGKNEQSSNGNAGILIQPSPFVPPSPSTTPLQQRKFDAFAKNTFKSSSFHERIDSFLRDFSKEKTPLGHTTSCTYATSNNISNNNNSNNNNSNNNNNTNKTYNNVRSGFLNNFSRHRSYSIQSIEQDDDNTPNTTPLPGRKNNRRRSNIFNSKKEQEERKKADSRLGSGRVIPIKQGCLYKRSNKTLSREWQKKYVTLLQDGRFVYHPSLHDYMEDVHGKEIKLGQSTVKIPGQGPRGSEVTKLPTMTPEGASNHHNNEAIGSYGNQVSDANIVISNSGVTSALLSANTTKHNNDITTLNNTNNNNSNNNSNNSSNSNNSNNNSSKVETPLSRRKHRRIKSNSRSIDPSSSDVCEGGYEFAIVSLNNKQYLFEASSPEEREEWVTAIEQQILLCLQANCSSKDQQPTARLGSMAVMRAVREVEGNRLCADCGAPEPVWASLNLGALICIECSGVHRNLGSHLSRVRSLELDDWPPNYVEVMVSIGNHLCNSVWEANAVGCKKPLPTSSRDEKDKWIRSKYELKNYLPPLPFDDVPIQRQLMDAVACNNINNLIIVLAYCTPADVNTPYNNNNDSRTALHIAAAFGKVVFVQLLLWYGADAEQRDHEGHTASFYAREHQATQCLTLLQQH